MEQVKEIIHASPLPSHVQAFYNTELYKHPTGSIEMIQTHISWVFLTGNFVYKLKKPVDLGFLDYSTLEKRKFYCEQELLLNRRLMPDVYLEVCSVCLCEGEYNLSGDGEVIDYCLKMVQFDQAGLFDKMLEQGEFKPEWMDTLAKDIAFFHAQAEVNSNPSFKHASYIEEHIQANLNVASAHIEKALSEKNMKLLRSFAKTELEHKQVALKERLVHQHIRHCHGDLHFRNITLWEGKPRAFDCIEFNDEYRIIDTMNDVAFLLMDCDAHKRADLGMRFLSRYLEHSADYDGLSLLSLYLFYRASVRGKVACILADELPYEQQGPQWQEARNYFNLALNYTQKNKPTLFAIGGLSGSGKSHLALLGCGVESAIVIRSDATRKRISINFPERDLYGDQMGNDTYQAMFDAAKAALEAGFSVIMDATFLQSDSRQQVYDLAKNTKCPMHFYWLEVAENTLRHRIKKRIEVNKDISDADLDVLSLQLAKYEKPNEPWIHCLDSSDSWINIDRKRLD